MMILQGRRLKIGTNLSFEKGYTSHQTEIMYMRFYVHAFHSIHYLIVLTILARIPLLNVRSGHVLRTPLCPFVNAICSWAHLYSLVSFETLSDTLLFSS